MTAITQTNVCIPPGVSYALTKGQYDLSNDSSTLVSGREVYWPLVPANDRVPDAKGTIILDVNAVQKAENERSSDALPESIRDNWQGLARSKLSDELYGRLQRLANKPDGWRGKNSRRLSAMSLRRFLNFWRLIEGRAIEPFVTLAPNGHLYAEWHASWKRHLDVEFADNGDVFYGLFHGIRVHEGREEASELARMLLSRRSNPLKWGN